MAVTQVNYTGNGSTTNYSFTFPYLEKTDVQVRIDGTIQATTAYSFANATTIAMDTAPASGAKIAILRNTNNDSKKGTFYAGSAIKAEDLNDNFDQILYVAQEVDNYAMTSDGTTPMTGDLTLGEDLSIVFEGATDDAFETELTVADPTADRVVTIPNETGTIVTTGSTGVVTSTMITDATIVAGDIANTTITGAKIANDTITATQIAANAVTASELADSAVDTAAIAADAVTGAKIADDSINSEHYADGSIDTAHIADNQVTTAKIADDGVTQAKIASDAVGADQILDDAVRTAHILNSQVTTAKIADDAITTGKIADSQVTTAKVANLSISEAKIAANAVTTTKIADNSVTGAKIAAGTLGTTDLADNSITTGKLAADCITEGQIADDAINSEHYVDGSIDTAHIADSQVTTAKIAADAIDATRIADNAVTTDHIADAELTTLAGMQAGTASVLAGGTALAATLTEINTICDGKSVQTTISDTDASYPTSGAVVDYVAAQIAPLGGLEVIATEVAFPNTQPASGVVISISDAGGVVFNGSGTSTTGRTVGSSTVTINNAPSSLNSETLAAGVGLMVSSTGSGQVYNYHKILGKEDDIKQLSDDINDFNARYRVNAGEPSSNNDEGDLVYDTNADKMKVYDSSTSAWKEVTSVGDFKFIVLTNTGTTNAATYNGSNDTYDLKETSTSGSAASLTNAYQLWVSLNGVIQKPNEGTFDGSAEGFYRTDADTIRFCDPPPTGSSVFAIQIGSAVTLNTPADDTVATAKIQNLAVTTAKIAADAVTGAKIADDAVGAEHIEVLDADLQLNDSAKLRIGTGNDLELFHQSSDESAVIKNVNDTGWLRILSGDSNSSGILLKNRDDDVTYLKAFNEGSVELYYNNSKKFETISTGAKVTGNLHLDGGSSGTDAYVYTNNAAGIVFQADENGHIFQTYASGGWQTRLTITDAGNVRIPDNGKFTAGAGDDLQIFHDGSHSFIKDAGTGNLRLGAADLRIQTEDFAENYILGTKNGSVDLYYDNSKKFETYVNGAIVTGALSVTGNSGTGLMHGDNVKAVFGGGDDLQIYYDGTDGYIRNHVGGQIVCRANTNFLVQTNASDGGADNAIKALNNAAVELYYDNSKKFETTSYGADVTGRLNVSNLRIPDYDASTDLGQIRLGDTNDLLIYHDGSNSHIYQDGTGDLQIRSDNSLEFNTNGTENAIWCDTNGAVKLYYDSTKVVETTSTGLEMTAQYIKHTPASSFYIRSAGSILLEDINGGNYFKGNTSDKSAKMYYQDVEKLTTTTGGITVTGSVTETSDVALKTDIEPIDNVLDKIQQITGYTYKFKDTGYDSIGVTAQDVEKVFPELVHGEEGTKTLQYSGLIGALIESVKELSNKVAALEAK